MRILVTGADGFTGRYLLPLLRDRGHQALPLMADITDAPVLAAEVAAILPDATVHLAGLAFAQPSDSAGFYRVNQLGTFNLLDALAEHAPDSRVLLASTGQVYGAAVGGMLSEKAALKPGGHYAVSKAAMELGAPLWADRLRLIIARPFNYTGVGQEERYLVPKIVTHFRRRAPVIELGNTHVRRDWGDVRSVVAAYAGLLEGGDPATVNVSTGVLHAIDDLLARLTAMTGHRIEVVRNPDFVRANDVAELGGANDRLRATLPDWAAHDIDDTLHWMMSAS